MLVVKPQDMASLLDEIAAVLRPGHARRLARRRHHDRRSSRQRLPDGTPVVRVMPNTPALVDEGMAAISPARTATTSTSPRPRRCCSAVGKVVRVPEKQQDAVTAISGSGPAYIFYVVEAMIEAGVLLGLPRSTANELVVQTLVGAAKMLKETGEHPTVLRENVTSPAGTTVAALRELDDHKVRAAFLSAHGGGARPVARARRRATDSGPPRDEWRAPRSSGTTTSRRTTSARHIRWRRCGSSWRYVSRATSACSTASTCWRQSSPTTSCSGWSTRPAYVDGVRRASITGAADLAHGLGTPDDPVFPGMHEASAHVVGATVAAVRAVVGGSHDHAVNLAGGLHHAMADPPRASASTTTSPSASPVRWPMASSASPTSTSTCTTATASRRPSGTTPGC